MMNGIEKVRDTLLKLIQEHQEAGIPVRNKIMAERFGGERGYPSALNVDDDPGPVCLRGLLPAGGDQHRAYFLGIDEEELRNMEAGFEAWANNPDFDHESPFYKLGREIGDELERAEEVAHQRKLAVIASIVGEA